MYVCICRGSHTGVCACTWVFFLFFTACSVVAGTALPHGCVLQTQSAQPNLMHTTLSDLTSDKPTLAFILGAPLYPGPLLSLREIENLASQD